MRSRVPCLLPLVLAAGVSGIAQPARPAARFEFQGRLLVVACDTDMLPSAYVDGKLGPAVGPDVLSVIRLGGADPAHLPVSTVPVTNSVTGPPAAVTVTPDGHFALVAETQGTRPPGKPDATMADLAPGKKLTVVDLADPAHPRVTQQIESHERAVSVAINPAGTLVAVAFAPRGHPAEAPLVLFPFRNGRLGTPFEPRLPGFAPGDDLVDAEFLPGADILAVLFTSKAHPRLSFFHTTGSGAELTLTPWGDPIALDPSPFLVRFTPDARFALVNSMQQDPNHRGTLTSIQLAATGPDPNPRHQIVSHVEAGELPEGLAISPDGLWVATANLEESFEPLTDPKQQFFASVSLLRLDPATGRLTRVGEFPFDGILPEPIVFDNSSRFIAAASFGRYDSPTAGGSLHFWRIADHNPETGRVELIQLNESVPLTRGPQSIAIVR